MYLVVTLSEKGNVVGTKADFSERRAILTMFAPMEVGRGGGGGGGFSDGLSDSSPC